MYRVALLLGLLWANVAAATMSAAERQSLTDAFDPLLSSRAAAEKCLSPDAETKAKFDRQFRALAAQAVGSIPPYRGEARDALVVEAFQTILGHYPLVQQQVAEIAAERTCLGPEIKEMVHIYRRIAAADWLKIAPPIKVRLMWEEGSCTALAMPEDVRETDHAALGKYGLLVTPDGRVAASKIVQSAGDGRLDALSIQYLSSCRFIPVRLFGHPINTPDWTELSHGWGG